MHFQKDFNINRCVTFEVKYANFIRTVKYHWVVSPVPKYKGWLYNF